MKITLSEVNKDFRCVEVNMKDLKNIIKDFIKGAYPEQEIDVLETNDDGILIILSNGQEIEIEIDWNELVIK